MIASLVHPFDRDGACVFRGLNHLTGYRNQLLVVMVLVNRVLIRVVHELESMAVAFVRVLLGAFGFSDPHGVARFVELQRQACIQNDGIDIVPRRKIATSFHELKLCVYFFCCSTSVWADGVFEHNDITGLLYSIVRLRCNDESKRLKRCGHLELAAAVIANQNFAKIDRSALRRDSPENVGQILATKAGWLVEVREFSLDRNRSAFALDLGLASGRQHQLRAGEIKLRASAAVLVIHCLDRAIDRPDSESWSTVFVAVRWLCLRIDLNKPSHAEYPG